MMQSFTTSAIMSQSLVSESEIFKSSAKMMQTRKTSKCKQKNIFAKYLRWNPPGN